jgi:peptidoglycan-associated lipoprotein
MEQAPARFDVAATYNSLLANVTTGEEFSMQGGSVQAQARLWRRLCAVADVAGFHTGNVNGSGIGLDLITATFGPRYVWSPSRSRVVFFGQALIGEAHGSNSIFPSSTGTNSSGNSFALQLGGGVDYLWTDRLSLRALDADWLRTQLPNATTNVQNNLRLGIGVIYRVK